MQLNSNITAFSVFILNLAHICPQVKSQFSDREFPTYQLNQPTMRKKQVEKNNPNRLISCIVSPGSWQSSMTITKCMLHRLSGMNFVSKVASLAFQKAHLCFEMEGFSSNWMQLEERFLGFIYSIPVSTTKSQKSLKWLSLYDLSTIETQAVPMGQQYSKGESPQLHFIKFDDDKDNQKSQSQNKYSLEQAWEVFSEEAKNQDDPENALPLRIPSFQNEPSFDDAWQMFASTYTELDKETKVYELKEVKEQLAKEYTRIDLWLIERNTPAIIEDTS